MEKVSNEGRITIPKNLRTKYNLNGGAEYQIIEDNDCLKIVSRETKYNIDEEDMKALRKLYIMLSDSGIMDSYYDEILSRITKKTETKCDKCGNNLFLTKENTFKCFKCE